jgi:tetratricopeptide (TPR) repeat protein
MRDFTVGNLIKSYRTRLGLQQNEVADPDDPALLPFTLRTYQGWENGERIPSNERLRRIASFFHLTDAEADELYRAAAQVAPEIHNLPFFRNPYFTGREKYLEQMEQHFNETGSVAITQPISISGLGGIGKTELALAYAHRYCSKTYRTVLWTNAANKTTLEASYLSLAQLLKLPEKDEREIDHVIQAVKKWLEGHINWLLIFDNADDLPLVRTFLPATPHGHILLTTRSQIVGDIATPLVIDVMEPEEGLYFLLRRSGVLKHQDKLETVASDVRKAAARLVGLLGGHPLALDQAGAYIDNASCSFDDYIQIYNENRLLLLNKRGFPGDKHPEAVTVTFKVSFQQACELCPTVADVLHFCAFLHPDDIPEELFSQDGGLKLDKIKFDEAIMALNRYSLIKRNADRRFLSVHRLVQAVLADGIDAQAQRLWAERIVCAMNHMFPVNPTDVATWSHCLRYLDQVQACYTLIERHRLLLTEAADILNRAGIYLVTHAFYPLAEQFYQRALFIQQQSLDPFHSDITALLNNLAGAYIHQSKYTQAEPLLRRAHDLCEQYLEPEHHEIAYTLNHLALLSKRQGKYEQAEPFYVRALSIYEQLDPEYHDSMILCLNNLAELYHSWGKYKQAEPLFVRALVLFEQQFGPGHPQTIIALNNLAHLYMNQGKYEQAEPLLARALTISEQQLGPEHPQTAAILSSLASPYMNQGKYEQAEPLLIRALTISEQRLGPEHPQTAAILRSLANLSRRQGQYEQAEPLLIRALTISEQQLGLQHPDTATGFNELAVLYLAQGKDSQAEPLFLRSLSINEALFGPEYPSIADTLYNLASLYIAQRKDELAESLLQHALTIYEQAFGPQHFRIADVLALLASLYIIQKKDELVEPLYTRACSILKQQLGSNLPDTIAILDMLSSHISYQRKRGPVRPTLEHPHTMGKQPTCHHRSPQTTRKAHDSPKKIQSRREKRKEKSNKRRK